ncbi:MAG TPA: hypothetical protein VHZ52_15575 [Acidobacteriaceae bacterium]|jgi:hypothetical protein|nr:hypothetical protein [Acidobacteriaceae bacterium]
MGIFRYVLLFLLVLGPAAISCAGQTGLSQLPDDSLTPGEKLDQECRLDYHQCQVDFDHGARGKPEAMLAGIDLRRGHIGQIILRFGKPLKFEDMPVKGCPECGGERHYMWQKNGWILRVKTEYSRNPTTHHNDEDEPSSVSAERTALTGGTVKTGKGLLIGDTESTFKRIYGTRFIEGTNSKTGKHYIKIEWAGGIDMFIDFDTQSKICRIEIDAYGD